MTIKKTIYDVIIIGSGIAGLSAARYLHDKGQSVLVLDKGRRIGGRCATKRIEGFTFNYGAQFLTTKEAHFTKLAQEAEAEGALIKWSFGHNRPCYIGAPTMRDLPQWLASGLTIEQSVKITSITQDEGLYHLLDETGNDYHTHRLILTPPAPQTKALLEELSPLLANTANEALYNPCWTVMVGLHSPCERSKLPLRDRPPIGWASAEDARLPSDPSSIIKPAVTIQADPDTSRHHLHDTSEDMCQLLISAFEEVTEQKLDIALQAAHRWLYARIAKPADESAAFCDHNHHLAIAGDWFGKARLETAFHSGLRAAKAIYQNE